MNAIPDSNREMVVDADEREDGELAAARLFLLAAQALKAKNATDGAARSRDMIGNMWGEEAEAFLDQLRPDFEKIKQSLDWATNFMVEIQPDTARAVRAYLQVVETIMHSRETDRDCPISSAPARSILISAISGFEGVKDELDLLKYMQQRGRAA